MKLNRQTVTGSLSIGASAGAAQVGPDQVWMTLGSIRLPIARGRTWIENVNLSSILAFSTNVYGNTFGTSATFVPYALALEMFTAQEEGVFEKLFAGWDAAPGTTFIAYRDGAQWDQWVAGAQTLDEPGGANGRFLQMLNRENTRFNETGSPALLGLDKSSNWSFLVGSGGGVANPDLTPAVIASRGGHVFRAALGFPSGRGGAVGNYPNKIEVNKQGAFLCFTLGMIPGFPDLHFSGIGSVFATASYAFDLVWEA